MNETTELKLQQALNSKGAIKNAIEAKGVTVGNASFDEYASKIEAIPTPIVEAPENDVNFYDYDGFRVASYTIEEAKALTQAGYDAIWPPAHEGLTFQEWNWSLSDITSYDRQYIDVGANYVTTDGKTRIYLHAEDNEEFSFSAQIITSATLYVDWGDGNSETQTGAITLSHTYTTKGHYVVTFYSNLPEGTTFKLMVLNDTKISCVHMVDEINVGKDVYVGNNYVFRYHTCKISISTASLTDINAGCFTNAIMPMVVVPKTCTSLSSTIGFATHCGMVSLPRSMTTLGAASFFFGYNSPKLILPEVTDVSWAAHANYFNNSPFIEIVSLPLSFKWDSSVTGNFNSMGNLYYVDIAQGWTPNVSLNISSSTKWTATNIVKFFNKLGETSTAITLAFGATNLNKLTEEEKAIATNKGYTLA